MNAGSLTWFLFGFWGVCGVGASLVVGFMMMCECRWDMKRVCMHFLYINVYINIYVYIHIYISIHM